MASSASPSSRARKHQVFLSFRGEDTRYNFTGHLLKALKDTGIDVSFDIKEKLETKEELPQALSDEIAVSNLSIIVLSKGYASSKSCLAELSVIMDLKRTQGHAVLPIFYHVDPSHVRGIVGSFKTSFERYKSKNRPELERWKSAFSEVGSLKGLHIQGGKFDRSETEHIKDVVESVKKGLVMKHQIFLSLGEDTRRNFTSHLLKALKGKGLDVFFDEEKLERGEELSPTLSRAIAASRLSIIVLSSDYASSKSCLAELSGIMDRRSSHGQIVLPIFYHVDPFDFQNLGGSFKTSFDDHESKRLPQIQRWKTTFAKVGELKGWHIEGGKFDRPDTEYIEDVVKYVIKKLDSESSSVSEYLVGIDDQKRMILGLIQQEESRVIGLWGMGGMGKTTLAEAVYSEISPKFQSHCFLHNAREEIENKGMESVRNEFLSKLLNSKIEIDNPAIVSIVVKERLNNMRIIAVLDDVDDSRQIDFMGVKHFGVGSKVILTSRNRQVLNNGGADKIHDVKKLNAEDSLQLFSTFAFKQMHPAAEFRDLSYKFVHYADGSPLALKILGSKLYKKSREMWESEMDKLRQYGKLEISQLLKNSFYGLDQPERNIFLDIACFFRGEFKNIVEEILSCTYKDAVSGISNLLDKCLLDITPYGQISMHDMLEEMGKEVVRQESKHLGKCSRLLILKHTCQVRRRHTKGTELIEGIILEAFRISDLLLQASVFENMFNLKYIHVYGLRMRSWDIRLIQNPLANVVSIPLPNELKYLRWEYYPFKSLSSSFHPKNLVVLKLHNGNMEQLWNEDYQDLGNLREIDVSFSMNLRKIPNLSKAINLKSLHCIRCTSLFELPCFNGLTSLEILNCSGCESLVKLPCLNGLTSLEILDCSGCQSLFKLPCLNGLTSLKILDCSGCQSLVELPCLNGLTSLEILDCSGCQSLVELPCLNCLTSLETIRLLNCKNLRNIPCLSHLTSLEELDLTGCHKLKMFNELPSNFESHQTSNNISKFESLHVVQRKKRPRLAK